MKHGGLYVISGPSGSGKNTVLDGLCAISDNFAQTVSVTTRSPRPGESEGVDYYFKSVEQFEAMVENGEFIEYVKYGNNYYGTPKSEIARLEEMGKDVILIIEVNGALNIKKIIPDATLIFIMPPSTDELKRRLAKRGDTSESDIEARIKIAEEEMQYKSSYDHCVINDDIDRCVNEVYNTIISKGV